MFLALIILWPLTLALVAVYCYNLGAKVNKQITVPFHKVKEEASTIIIIERDEHDGELRRCEYKRSSRWLSGFEFIK